MEPTSHAPMGRTGGRTGVVGLVGSQFDGCRAIAKVHQVDKAQARAQEASDS